MLEQKIMDIINSDTYVNEALELNDALAQNPELSAKEYESSKKMAALLRDKGLQVEYPFANQPTAFKGTINGTKHSSASPRICILAEYDALPGIGHGCGHSASGSISILASLILHDLTAYFAGQIDIIGTPDEEVMGGKITMAEAGVFNDYDYAIMMHMAGDSCVFARLLAMDGIRVEFFGKTAHASSSPWKGRNALNAMQLFFHSIDMMRQHVKPDIKIHGVIKEGGQAANLVPDYTMCELYVRGNAASDVSEISQWVKDCARAAGIATKTEEVISAACPSLKDLSSNKYANEALQEKFDFYEITTTDDPIELGSSDIGDVDYICPAFHPIMGVKHGLDLHTKEMAEAMLTDGAHDAIKNGGRMIAAFIMETFLDEQLLTNIKNEYKILRSHKKGG